MKEIIQDWNNNAKKRSERNFNFIRSLKLRDSDKVDSLAKEWHGKAFEKIDCLECGNCCKVSKPQISKKDIVRISRFLKLSEKELKEKYLEKDEDNDWTTNSLPCPFLNESNNKCEIYEVRPKDCQEFPHTQKRRFSSRSYSHSSNTEVCPAVYYIVENMKKNI